MRAKLVFPITYRNVILFISNICFLYISTRELKKYSKSNFCVLSDWMEQHLMVKQCYKSLERLLFTFSPFILFQSFVWPKHWKIQGKWFRIHIYFLQQLILAYVFKLQFRTKVRKHIFMLKPLHFNSRPQNLLQKSIEFFSIHNTILQLYR